MRGITIFLLVALLLGCDSFNNVSDAEYIAKAQDRLDQGQTRSASIQLKNALSKNPNNPQARLLLGKVYVDMNFGVGAEKELTIARQLGVSDDSVVPLLAKALVQQQKYEEVIELGNGSTLSSEAATELWVARGLAYLGQGNTEQAAQELDAALEKNPESLYGLVAEARLSAAVLDYEAARRYLERALEIDPDYVPALSLLGDLNRVENKLEAAVDAYTRAIDKSTDANPERLVDQQKRALLLIQLKRYDEAQQDIDKLFKRNRNHPGVNFAQGMLHFRQQRWPAAEESFAQTLSSTSTDNLEALYYLGMAQFRQGNIEQATSNLSRYVTANPLRIQGRMGLALVKVQTRDYGDVVDLVRPVVATDGSNVLALNMLANALMNTGETEEAVELLQRIVVLRPDSAAARTELGIGQMRLGQEASGLENLESAIKLDPQYQQADILLVLNYLKEKSFDKALQAARAFVDRQPENALPYNLLGTAYLGLEETDAAVDAFNTALRLDPGNPSANYSLATLALQDGKPEQARAYYEDVLKLHENDLGALLRLVDLEAREQDTVAMKTLLEQAIAAHPEAVQPRRLLAKLYLLEGEPEQALTVLGDIPEQGNDLFTQGLLGEAQLAVKDYASARYTFQRLIDLNPGMAQTHFLLAQAYAGLNDQASMERELSKTLLLSPEHFYARLGVTRIQVLKGEIGPARGNLKQLQAVGPDHPDVLALEASIAMHSGEGEQALAAARSRFQAAPDSGSLLSLVRILWSAGEHQKAIDEMDDWLGTHGNDVTVRLTLAEAFISDDRKDEAIAQYEEVLTVSVNNQLALNNLASYLLESDPDRALELAEKAYSVPPKSGMVMDTLAAIWLEKGDLDRARRFNERALAQSPGTPTFVYRRAQILEAEGKPAAAVAELRSLLDSERVFPERKAAGEMLKRLGAL